YTTRSIWRKHSQCIERGFPIRCRKQMCGHNPGTMDDNRGNLDDCQPNRLYCASRALPEVRVSVRVAVMKHLFSRFSNPGKYSRGSRIAESQCKFHPD